MHLFDVIHLFQVLWKCVVLIKFIWPRIQMFLIHKTWIKFPIYVQTMWFVHHTQFAVFWKTELFPVQTEYSICFLIFSLYLVIRGVYLLRRENNAVHPEWEQVVLVKCFQHVWVHGFWPFASISPLLWADGKTWWCTGFLCAACCAGFLWVPILQEQLLHIMYFRNKGIVTYIQ